MRDCSQYEITIKQFRGFVHGYTERVQIKVITQPLDGSKGGIILLTDNLTGSEEETERVLKYYGDVPVWNLHVETKSVPLVGMYYGNRGHLTMSILVANCYYKDIKDGYLREKADIRKAKQREYRERKKRNEKSNTDNP